MSKKSKTTTTTTFTANNSANDSENGCRSNDSKQKVGSTNDTNKSNIVYDTRRTKNTALAPNEVSETAAEYKTNKTNLTSKGEK